MGALLKSQIDSYVRDQEARPGRRMPTQLLQVHLAGFDPAPLADAGQRLQAHRAGLEQARAELGAAALVAWESGVRLNKLATAAGVTPEVIVTATMKAHRKRGPDPDRPLWDR